VRKRLFNIEMIRKKCSSLLPNGWINDEVINFYFQLLQKRDDALHQCIGSPKTKHPKTKQRSTINSVVKKAMLCASKSDHSLKMNNVSDKEARYIAEDRYHKLTMGPTRSLVEYSEIFDMCVSNMTTLECEGMPSEERMAGQNQIWGIHA
jgi:hypothetical protein